MLLTILQDIFFLPIFNVLMFLYWLVRDFGLSIVLLTILVRLAMVPLTFKQLHSQRKMMEIQPQIARLKAEYGDDKQGFAKAQMQLMKENNVSMMGGCLPLLIQLPFLYGLFYALRSGLGDSIAAIKQNLYPFMYFTLNHGLPDTYLRWFSWLPGHPALNLNAADPTHVLPILAALFTFIQVRMMQGVRQQQKPLPGADPKTVAQQNAQMQTMSMMTYITPLFTLFIGWQYAAGLSLYWTVGTIFAVCQQYFIYGWGGLFKGIPRLEQWAAAKNAAHDARREARLIAKGVISPPAVVEGTLASANGAAKNGANGAGKAGAKGKDWIEQAKTQSGQGSDKKARPAGPRPFPTLMKPKETATLANTPKPEPQDNDGAANGSKSSSGVVGAAKGSAKAPPAKTKAQPTRRGGPPRSSTLPKPKGGKK